MPRTNFRYRDPWRLHMKFGFDWSSGFGEEDLWKWWTNDNGQRTDEEAFLYYKLTNEPKSSGELKSQWSMSQLSFAPVSVHLVHLLGPHLSVKYCYNVNQWSTQDQDSLLVKRRNDNHSSGPVIRELVPSSHQRSELSNTILCTFSRWDQRIGEGMPIPVSPGQEATFINICISNVSLECHRVLISATPSFGDKVIFWYTGFTDSWMKEVNKSKLSCTERVSE